MMCMEGKRFTDCSTYMRFIGLGTEWSQQLIEIVQQVALPKIVNKKNEER